MARVLVRLKLSLIRNGLRAGWQRQLGVAIGVATALPAAIGAFVLLTVTGHHGTSGRDVAVVGFTLLWLCWMSLPILGFGSDETLDPSRLATLPLTRRELMAGLVAASLVGVAPLATMLGLAGTVAGFTRSVAGLVIAIAAVVLEVGLCVTASRAVVTGLSRMLRSRRGRDVSILLIALVALLPQFLRIAVPVQPDRSIDLAPLAGTLRWIPPGLAAHAAVDGRDGRLLAAVGELSLAAAAVGILLIVWSATLRRSMTTAEASSGPGRSRGAPASSGDGSGTPLLPRHVPFLRPTNVGAVAARELRFVTRDPRRRVQLLYGFLMPAFAFLPLLAGGHLHDRLAVLLALGVAFFLGGLPSLNQIGVDGAAYWTNVSAGHDPRADLHGKNLATTLVTLPAVTVVACAVAAYNGGWAWVPVAVVLAVAMLGVEFGVGNVVSVVSPQPVPDTSANMWGQRTGQGCASAFINAAAMFIEMMLLVPILVVVAVAVAWPAAIAVAAPAAVLYGFVLWRVGTGVAVRRVWWRLPELLDAVAPRHAA